MKFSLLCEPCDIEYDLSDDEKEAKWMRPQVEYMHQIKSHGNIKPTKFIFKEDD